MKRGDLTLCIYIACKSMLLNNPLRATNIWIQAMVKLTCDFPECSYNLDGKCHHGREIRQANVSHHSEKCTYFNERKPRPEPSEAEQNT